jgi:hypothetical protein
VFGEIIHPFVAGSVDGCQDKFCKPSGSEALADDGRLKLTKALTTTLTTRGSGLRIAVIMM